MVLAHPPDRDRWIGGTEANERAGLLTPGHHPEAVPGPVDDGVRQRHPTSALVNPGQSDIGVGDVKHRVAGDQGGGMAVRPEAEVNEIEYRRRAGDVTE